MIRGIVQYEVFTFDDGRWQLSSRYPGAQREDAIREAGHLEFVTGRPTKVVKDTYYPDTNRNEESTAYLSPKGRALKAVAIRRLSATAVARRDIDPISGRTKRPAAAKAPRVIMRPRRNTRAEMTVRIIVAIGASLLFATIITAVISTIFTQVAKVVTSIPADASNFVIAGTYLLVFLYTFPRTLRRRGRIHQIILEMWENTSKPGIAKSVPMPEKARPRRKKERPWDLMRFDTPPAPPALDTNAPTPPPPSIEPVVVAAPPPPAPSIVDFKLEKAKADAEKAKAEAEKAKAEAAKAKKEAEKKQQAELPPAPPSPAAAAPTAEDNKGFILERIVLRRFAVDVVVPAVARAHRDDPVTRRGMALILVGAVQGIGETTKITDGAATTLLTEALLQTGTKRPSIDSFLANYHNHIASPAAADLLTAGKTAIKCYAEGGSNIGQLLLDALTVWRFPGMAQPVNQRVSYYLLSESQNLLEEGVESADGVALHDTTARMAVLERGGEIIPHEGSGIFARFSDEETARVAAEAIRASIATIAELSVLVGVAEYAQPAAEVENTAAALEQTRIALRLSAATEIAGEPTPFETTSESPVVPVTAPEAKVPASVGPPPTAAVH